MPTPESTPPAKVELGNLSDKQLESGEELIEQIKLGPTTIQPGEHQPVTMRGHDGQHTFLESEDATNQRVLAKAKELQAGMKVCFGTGTSTREVK